MTVQEVISKLQAEKQQRLPGRFHCRAILVRTVAQYRDLLEQLKALGDIKTVSADDLFSGADVMPNYEKLTEKEYQNQWIILSGVSEYLRLFHASEETEQRFGTLWHFQSDASTIGRILIPLWGCETLWYDKALHLYDERQEEDVFDCTGAGEPQKMNIQVLSGDFEQYLTELGTSHGSVSCGLKEWHSYWNEPEPEITDHLILTKRYRSIKPTDGDIKIQVVDDTLSFIRENLTDGHLLKEENCPKDAQQCLFPYALKGKTIDQAILLALNSQEFRSLDMMNKWANMTKGQKQLIFLWYALHPDDSYLGHCVSLAKDINDLTNCILTAIFPAHTSHPEWIEDSQALIAAVPIERTDEYFSLLDEIPTPEERLNYLTSGSLRERIYILHMVGQWLRVNRDAVLSSQKLKDTFPVLAAYLSDDYPDEELKNYFAKYKTYKLSNTLPMDEESYFSGFDTSSYDFRYPVLCESVIQDQTFVLWIDALGAEWLPLLKWALETSSDGNITSVKVALSQLPSETCFNEQWHQMELPYEKYDKLDKLAHKGVIDDKDYYACVEEQFHFVGDIVHIVDKKLTQYSRVLITGDHGTSRLAARFFHKLDGMPVPPHAELGSHGRYCRVIDDQLQPMPTQKQAKDNDGNKYYVFANYDHYAKSGFAAGVDDDVPVYGEIHGGAAPEEVLVPVISINSLHEIPLTAKWTMPGNSTKIVSKRAKCRLQFSRPVSTVKAKINDNEAECSSGMIPSKDWVLTFAGLKPNKPTKYSVSILADDTLVNVEQVEIKPALGGDDPF